MLGRILLGVALALPLATVAHAASFDCSKAKTPFAKAICTNPQLSKADDAVAAAFGKALVGLSSPAKAEVQGAQDSWVKFASLACTKDAKLQRTPYDADGVSCLQSLFEDRTQALGRSTVMGGLRIYSVDRFAALADPDPQSDGQAMGTKIVSTPRIDGSDALAKAFNRYIETGIKDEIDPGIATNPQPGDGNEDDENVLAVSTVTPVRISMTLNSYQFGHGAAHGNYGISYLHFLRDPARALVGSDIFSAPGWQQRLQALALATLKASLKDDLMLDNPADINAPVIDPSRWDFSAAGLIIQFQPYEVAAYAAGAPTITIPWSKLKGDLAPGAAAIVGAAAAS